MVADEFADLSPLLSRLSEHAPRIATPSPAGHAESLATCNPHSHPRQGDALVRMLRERGAAGETVLRQTERVLPKGRNFH
jgi:hypothetical protein